MLTKEECEKALKCLFDELCENDITCKSRDVLDDLINEHFDNPPLKFSDLREGMWVWDDRYKIYDRVILLDTPLRAIETGTCCAKFKENRFYKREKED